MKKAEFNCCLVGCLFKCNKHRDYIRHLKRFHSKEPNLSCEFGLACTRTFSSLENLLDHIKQAHCSLPRSSVVVAPMQVVEIHCKCVMIRCMGKQFSNIKALMLHMRSYHVGEAVECIFFGCDKTFTNSNTLRGHFFEKHLKLNQCILKDVHRLDHQQSASNIVFQDIDDQAESEMQDVEDNIAFEEIYDERGFEADEDTEDGNLDENVLMGYCDFLNRMANFHFIPQSTIQIIGDEYLQNYVKSNQAKMKILEKSLAKVPGISDSEIQRVLHEFQNEDAFLEAQGKLNTEYKRVQFLKEKFVFVEPEEIVLNPKQVREAKSPKAVVHYVNVIETVRNLVQDPSFNNLVERTNVADHSDTKLRDVKDGQLFKRNPFFQENNGAYTMMLYSDAIELVNPLGAGRGRHKVIQIFFSLCEIPKHQRSKIDRIMLVAVFKEKLVKRFGFKKIYEKLIKDLMVLEGGITVNYPVQRIIKCGVLIHPADNLEAHGVGGFSQCFSSKDICRKALTVKYARLD